MQSLLTRSLTEISKNVIKSPQGSTYFCINKIKVRVSDHMSDSTDGDLAIIPALRGYVVFPLRSVNRKQIIVLPNVTAVINYVKQYAYFYNIFVSAQEKAAVKSQQLLKKEPDFKRYKEVWGWLTTKACPENIELLSQIFGKITDTLAFRSLLAQYAGLNAQQKNLWLKEYLAKLNP